MMKPRESQLALQRQLHDLAYEKIHRAIDMEESSNEHLQEIIDLYQAGSSLLNRALSLQHRDDEWQRAQLLDVEMRRSLSMVQERAQVLLNRRGRVIPSLSSLAKVQQADTKGSEPMPKNLDPKLANFILNEILVDSAGVKWEDVIGLDRTKSLLQELVILPRLRPDLYTGLRAPAKGVLLFGPPGTGKTMVAKALAHECNAKFFAMSASTLVSKYMGESERLIRTMFELARHIGNSVIFIDEIDSLLGRRKEEGEHEASRRLKTEFLVQFDGVKSDSRDDGNLLVIAATNRPMDLDEAARRRFPHRIYIPLPGDETRLSLLKHLLVKDKHQLSRRDFSAIVKWTSGYSCSDVTALAKEAALHPLRELSADELKRIKKEKIRPLCLNDFELARQRIRASVSQEEVVEVEKWAQQFGSTG